MTFWGTALLWFAFSLILWGIGSQVIGIWTGRTTFRESGIRAYWAAFGVLTLASISLVWALLHADYSLRYVVLQISQGMEWPFRISAFWAGMDGSMLFWSWVTSLYTPLLLWITRKERHDEIHSWAYATIGVALAFFVFITVFLSNPFAPYTGHPVSDGRGMNPLLLNVWMHVHPVSLYLGYTGFTIPFGYAIASLLTADVHARWVRFIRMWILVPWIFLTLGILFGGRWAYLELGWGGYWAWDPVENASLIPWLTATALLHSIIVQEKRGMLKVWNIFLASLTFVFALTGTYITRSGALTSVHAFAQSELGPWFAGAVWATLIFTTGLILIRKQALKSEHRLETLFSREGFFLLNNWVFLALSLTVAWGTLFPMISEAFTGRKITVGAPFFNTVTPPLFYFMLFLMTAAPVISWRRGQIKPFLKAVGAPALGALLVGIAFGIAGFRGPGAFSGIFLASWVVFTTFYEVVRVARVRMRRKHEGWRAFWAVMSHDRRRYGGYLVHVGVAFLTLGIVGSYVFQERLETVQKIGETLTFADHTVTLRHVTFNQAPDYTTWITTYDVQNPRSQKTLRSEYRFYPKWNMNTSEASIWPQLFGDFYIVTNGYDPDRQEVTTVMFFNPLVGFVWLGGLIIILGGIFALTRRTPTFSKPRPRTGVVS